MERRPFKYINAEKLVKEVSQITDYYEEDVKMIYDVLMEVVTTNLLGPTKDYDIMVRFTDGIRIRSSYIPEHEHTHPTVEGLITVPETIKFRAIFSKKFKENMIKRYRKELTYQRALEERERQNGYKDNKRK